MTQGTHGSIKQLWGIHTLDDNLFLKQNIIAIGWYEIGDLNAIENSRDAFKARFQQVYSDAKKGAIPVGAGMLYRFCHEVHIGDYVVFPSKHDRMINIGEITGDYKYTPDQPEYVQTRTVKWLKHLPRTAFTQGALYEVGSALTFFGIKNYADEFLSALKAEFNPKKTIVTEDLTITHTADEIIETTKDFILKKLSQNLKGYPLEAFVANLLQAMGYRTKISPQGGDNGIDITAYKDELPPRIVVQVKSQDGNISASTIQSLKGAMREGDYGLFITLSDYSKGAQDYLDSMPIIRGINGTELVDLVLKYYSSLDEIYQSIIPLKMVYIPMPQEDEAVFFTGKP